MSAAEAFNVFLDVFDNDTYENNRSLAFMDVNEEVIYEFNITASSESALVTAIVDFDNLVDEEDETNNIAQKGPDNTAPVITILSPVNNTNYQTASIDLNWTSDEELSWCAYSLNDG